MKLAKVLAILGAAGALATDKKPEELEALIAAADSMPGNVASSKEIEDRMSKDRAARDARRAKDRAAKDAKKTEDRKAEDKARDEKRAARDAKMNADRGANDKTWAKDREDDPEGTNDKVMGAHDAFMKKEGETEDGMEAAGMDEDYSTAGDPTTPGGNRGGKPAVDTAEAVKVALAARDDLHAARAEVEPILGKVTMDSAAEVRRAGLKKLGVDAAAVHDSALAGMLQMAKDRVAAPVVAALDAAPAAAAVNKLIPGLDRLK